MFALFPQPDLSPCLRRGKTLARSRDTILPLSAGYLLRQMTATLKIYKPASTCYWKSYPEPAGLSGASASSGEAFTLDSPRARGIIFTQVEALKNSRRHLTVLLTLHITVAVAPHAGAWIETAWDRI